MFLSRFLILWPQNLALASSLFFTKMAASNASSSRTLRADDPHFEKRLQAFVDECDSEAGEVEEPDVIESNHSSDSELEADENYEPETENNGGGGDDDSVDDNCVNNRCENRNGNSNVNTVIAVT